MPTNFFEYGFEKCLIQSERSGNIHNSHKLTKTKSEDWDKKPWCCEAFTDFKQIIDFYHFSTDSKIWKADWKWTAKSFWYPHAIRQFFFARENFWCDFWYDFAHKTHLSLPCTNAFSQSIAWIGKNVHIFFEDIPISSVTACLKFRQPENFPRICMPDIHNSTLVSDFTFQPRAGGSHRSSSILPFTSSWQSTFRNVAGGLDFDAYLFHNSFWLGRQKLRVCGLHQAQLLKLDEVVPHLVRVQVAVSFPIGCGNFSPGGPGLFARENFWCDFWYDFAHKTHLSLPCTNAFSQSIAWIGKNVHIFFEDIPISSVTACLKFRQPENFPRICMPDIHNSTLVSDFTFQPRAGGSHRSSSILPFTSSWQSTFRNVAGGLDFDAYLFHNSFWLGRQKLRVCGLHQAQLLKLDEVVPHLVRVQVAVSFPIGCGNFSPGGPGLDLQHKKILHCAKEHWQSVLPWLPWCQVILCSTRACVVWTRRNFSSLTGSLSVLSGCRSWFLLRYPVVISARVAPGSMLRILKFSSIANQQSVLP